MLTKSLETCRRLVHKKNPISFIHFIKLNQSLSLPASFLYALLGFLLDGVRWLVGGRGWNYHWHAPTQSIAVSMSYCQQSLFHAPFPVHVRPDVEERSMQYGRHLAAVRGKLFGEGIPQPLARKAGGRCLAVSMRAIYPLWHIILQDFLSGSSPVAPIWRRNAYPLHLMLNTN